MNYIVKENDTLDSIARRFNVSTIDIIKANNLNTYFLVPGTNLIIPSVDDSLFIDYVVNKGDSLFSISQRYNINPVILAEINGLKLYDYIYPNQIIIVPKENTKLYITQDGDTLNSIINRMNTNLSDLEKYNKNIYLAPGQLIVGKNNNI
ncbi:MAG: LysM peptidoglycan-binding domain-containing protein [Bacilli bacterium]|nr:LysM peptidoglycan-binding domain-containing protein [Bacilli bacterium]